jgi:hypothetical protein
MHAQSDVTDLRPGAVALVAAAPVLVAAARSGQDGRL